MNVIINLSALAPPSQDAATPASMLSYLNDNLARQFLSIKQFAKLHADYAPSSMMSSVLCCSMFGMPIYSYGWVLNHIDWNLISQYKIGKMKTEVFLNHLLNVFPFLKDTNFSEDIKQCLFKNKESLMSIRNLSNVEDLTALHIAHALLEQAWLARMQFSEETDSNVRHFFDKNQDKSIYIVANSNPMDFDTTIKYLITIYPDLAWLPEKELRSAIDVPNEKANMGISLTTDGHVKMYASYTHQAFKTGHADETNMTTDNLLKKLVEEEKIDLAETTFISQWSRDINMANELGIKVVTDSKNYFSPTDFNVTKAKVS